MINNPCTWSTSSSSSESFTYEGGSTLFHFSPNRDGLSNAMDTNIAFFADDEAHALDVLKRMFEFRIKCANEYIDSVAQSSDYHGFKERHVEARKMAEKCLKALNDGRVTVTPVRTTQILKVSWAGNDTVL